MTDPTGRRREYRARVLKRAFVLGGTDRPEMPCTVRNMHSGGAELKLSPEDPLPEEFLLHIPMDGLTYRCRLCWRRSHRCGVRFTGTGEKPAWHLA